jgi:hypothetical protein
MVPIGKAEAVPGCKPAMLPLAPFFAPMDDLLHESLVIRLWFALLVSAHLEPGRAPFLASSISDSRVRSFHVSLGRQCVLFHIFSDGQACGNLSKEKTAEAGFFFAMQL